MTNAGDGADAGGADRLRRADQPEPAQGNGYRIARDYFTLDGAPVDPAAIALNDRLVAVVTVTPERDIEARLIVVDPLPAGLEIENPNLLRSGETGQLAWLAADDVARHAEFRADRFVAAVDWQGAEPFRLAYMVRAVSPGSFHHPAASVEDMYRPAYRARTDAGRVEVSDARRERAAPPALAAGSSASLAGVALLAAGSRSTAGSTATELPPIWRRRPRARCSTATARLLAGLHGRRRALAAAGRRSPRSTPAISRSWSPSRIGRFRAPSRRRSRWRCSAPAAQAAAARARSSRAARR